MVAESPQVDRPVTAAFDDKGRLYVADSSGDNSKPAEQLKNPTHRVVMLESTKKDGKFDKSTVFADKLSFLQGTMWHDGSLYVATPPTIQKLTDTDGDGVADKREVWFDGGVLTGCANDVHGPYPGPDGRIYFTKGAFAKQQVVLRGGKVFNTKAAHIYRAKPDGSEIEVVMTGGMDNPVDVAFTPAGEMFFTTTFFQHPANGKRDGIVHATYGAVYGKDHEVVNDHIWAYPTLNEPMTHLGPAAPAGLHCYRSSAFGEDYANNLFVAQFNMAKVSRHALKPLGSTYRTEDSDFVVSDNRDFHPTDVIEDADGSLLIVDTGGWYKLCCPSSVMEKKDVLGAIYRVKKEGSHQGIIPVMYQSLTPKYTVNDVGKELTSENKFWRLEAANWCAAEHPEKMTASLKKLLKDDSLHIRRAAAEALGRIGDETAIPAILEALGSEPMDVPLQTALTRALIDIGDPVHIKAGLKKGGLTELASVIALSQISTAKYDVSSVGRLSHSLDRFAHAVALRLARDHADVADTVALRACEARDTETALRYVSLPDVQEQLAKMAGEGVVSATQNGVTADRNRAFAFSVMTASRMKNPPESWQSVITAMLRTSWDHQNALPAAKALGADKWANEDLKKALAVVAKDDQQTAEVRLSALAITAKLDGTLFAFVLENLKGSQPATLRSLAVEVLSKATLTPKQLVAVAEAIPTASPLDLDKLLAVFAKSADEEVGLALVKVLSEPKVRAAIRTEQVKPVLDKYPKAVQAAEAEKLYRLLESDRAELTKRLDSMLKDTQPGDVRKGQAVFNSSKAACTACHKVAYVGGLIGPDLTKIGSIRSEKDLLEAIIFPSASFVRSYEPVRVETKDGKNFSGLLKGDRPDDVVLTVSATEEVRIARKDIDEMKPGAVSVMPAGLDQQLTKQELADLVAFLKSLK